MRSTTFQTIWSSTKDRDGCEWQKAPLSLLFSVVIQSVGKKCHLYSKGDKIDMLSDDQC